MYTFEDKKTVSFRPTAEDAAFLNENMHLLRPEPRLVDGSPAEPTFREMCLFWAEKAIAIVKTNKTRQPEDVAKIEALEKQVLELQEIQRQNARELAAKTTDIELLTAQLEDKIIEIDALHNENSLLANDQVKENQIVLDLTPAELAVLSDQRAVLSKHEKRPVSNKDILFSLFWRYVTKQETQLSFPFLRSTKEIQNIIKNNQ